MTLESLNLGLYEKALPRSMSWRDRLAAARKLGFTFVELSVDETDERLARLAWSGAERAQFAETVRASGITVPTMCLSGHRRFPLGSHDPETRQRGRDILADAIRLAADAGIRTIQLAGYDVYYEKSDADTAAWFEDGLEAGLRLAARENVMLAVEIMDHPFMSSIVKFLNLKKKYGSPWFTVYPDVGNLSAWGNDVSQELALGFDWIVAIHLKDTIGVTADHPGTFKEVRFGSGCVDFPGVFRTLNALKYAGPFVIEMWTEKSDDARTEIAGAREWLLDRMREGGYLCA